MIKYRTPSPGGVQGGQRLPLTYPTKFIGKPQKKLVHDVMSFFGFDTSLPAATNEQHQEEDLAVYTWGTDDYSNLGQALQEGRDEFNDETFGSSEAVGRAYSGGIDSPSRS